MTPLPPINTLCHNSRPDPYPALTRGKPISNRRFNVSKEVIPVRTALCTRAPEGVAQNCILLYRRFVICRPSDRRPTPANLASHDQCLSAKSFNAAARTSRHIWPCSPAPWHVRGPQLVGRPASCIPTGCRECSGQCDGGRPNHLHPT